MEEESGRVEERQGVLRAGKAKKEKKRLYLFSLLTGRIQRPAQVPALSPSFFCFLLVLLHRPFINHAAEEQNVASHCRFSSVDVTDEDDIDMRLHSCSDCQ